MLRNFKAMISITTIFTSYFAYRFEFDQAIPKSDAKVFYYMVSILTLLLTMLNLLEFWIVKNRNDAKIILKKFVKQNTIFNVIKFVICLIHPNIFLFRKHWINEYTYNGSDTVFQFQRNVNEYLFLIQLTHLFF